MTIARLQRGVTLADVLVHEAGHAVAAWELGVRIGAIHVHMRVREGRMTFASDVGLGRFPAGSAPSSAAHGAAGSSQRTGIPSATGGATPLSSSARGLCVTVTRSSSARASSGVSVAICSFVSGPRRNDIAQRVAKSSGLSRWALWSRN